MDEMNKGYQNLAKAIRRRDHDEDCCGEGEKAAPRADFFRRKALMLLAMETAEALTGKVQPHEFHLFRNYLTSLMTMDY